MESRRRKVGHAPARETQFAEEDRRVDNCLSARFPPMIDRPRAPRNLRSSIGEELVGKVGRKKLLAVTAARRSDGDLKGFGKRKK